MAPTRPARAMLAALGAAALVAPMASATSIAGATSSAAGVVIRFTYVGSRSAPVVELSSEPTTDLPTGFYLVDTRTGLPVALVRTTITMHDLAVFQLVDVSESVVPVPEPASAMLLSFGVALIAARRGTRGRRRDLRRP
jgi:hypothetical protein